jgi:uncharacterized membrane protein (UPF0136 family)
MNREDSRALDVVAAAGLALGAVFGIAGTLVESAQIRQAFWAVDGIGIIVATVLLAVRFLRTRHDCVAAGFLVFAIGESLLLSGTAAGLVGSVPSFGAGVALWSTALLMTSLPRVFRTWIRLVGCVAALLFAITAGRIFWGETLLPTAAPLPSLGYPLLVLTFAGWIWTVLKER